MSAANDGDCVSVASGATSKTWRSTKRRKVEWTSQQCQNDALEILNTMPQKTRDLVISGNYGGGRIIKGVTHETPTMEMCEKHYVFVFPILKQHPLKVPSPFCLADTLIALDELLERKLLVIPGSKNPTTQTEKADLAMTEAKDLKRLCAHVRYLARDGRGSYSELMRNMKAVVKFAKKDKGDIEASAEDSGVEPEVADSGGAEAAPGSPGMKLYAPGVGGGPARWPGPEAKVDPAPGESRGSRRLRGGEQQAARPGQLGRVFPISGALGQLRRRELAGRAGGGHVLHGGRFQDGSRWRRLLRLEARR